MTASSIREAIARRSIEVLKQGQARSGAFVASPTFPVYRYAWLRDGAFCANALDLVGEHARAQAFHRWTAQSIEANRSRAESAIELIAAGKTPVPGRMPPARYTLNGAAETNASEPWPNFQTDGYGIWLWALAAHLRGEGLPPEGRRTVELVASYLRASWPLRCWNCWEELDGGEHASSLAAVYAGLSAAAALTGDEQWATEADVVRTALIDRFVHGGRFGRGASDPRPDGSLLWLAVPFAVLPHDDSRIRATVEAVKRELVAPGGGLYRYRGDTYYGGGEWLLLTSWLAWHDSIAGKIDDADKARAWVRAQAAPSGDLPEQVTAHAQDPKMVAPWVRRWGPVAAPLLWSHAMYLIAELAPV